METGDFFLGMIIGGIIVLPIIIFWFFYRILIPKNIFFTLGKENCAMYIMTGKKFTGEIIMPSKTLSIDTTNYEICIYNKNLSTKKSLLGIYWVGFYPFYSIYERKQQWMEWESTEKKRKIRYRSEMTPYLIVKPFEYAMFLEGGEDKNGVPLNVYFTVILKPTNAVLPIFGNDNAYGQVQTLCIAETLLFVKEKTFANLGGNNTPSVISNDDFSSVICTLNQKIPGRNEGIIEVLGYQIMDAKLDSIEIVGNNKEKILDATTKSYVAEETAKAIVATAKGNLEAAKLNADGKKIELQVQATYYKEISSIPGAMKVEERKVTPGLTTLVEGGVNGTNLSIGDKK